MKYVDEFRDGEGARRITGAIRRAVTRPWSIMEVCGGQTHAIVRFALDTILPPEVTLIHGPGCPVCVTPTDLIDAAIAIAGEPRVILCSFGDMLRVPGSDEDLLHAKSRGADVRMVYSPLDALALAEATPDREVVFFAVGFETTAPGNAFAVLEAKRRRVGNFSMVVSHVLVPPAMEAILASPERRVAGFLAAGHVCAVMGMGEYRPLAEKYRVPIVVTGFEPIDLLEGILHCVLQLERGDARVENHYARAVRDEGNVRARAAIEAVFEVVPRAWRGLGRIESSGLALRPEYADYDAERRFPMVRREGRESPDCKSGLVLQGLLKPPDCPAFGVKCTPEAPLGATMVSAEGACAAYYRYRARTLPKPGDR